MKTSNSLPFNPPRSLEELQERMKSYPDGVFNGVPGFFSANCMTAKMGGTSTYSDAGYHLGLHLENLDPWNVEPDEWLDILETELAPLVDDEDDKAVLAWLIRRYPRCMALIPRRRRSAFLKGFYLAMQRSDSPTNFSA